MAIERVDALLQVEPARWLALASPDAVFTADTPDDLPATIAAVEATVRARGWHAVGFITYEAGAAFGLPTWGRGAWPLAWFAAFAPEHVRDVPAPSAGHYTLGPVEPAVSRAAFGQQFARVKQEIAAGNTYQVNLTFPLRAAFAGDPLALFTDLIDAQQGAYGTFLRIRDRAICSASPELFFRREGSAVTVRPMKGTTRRGRTTAEDERRGRELRESAKQRAENVMIVDMMRSDLGRVATTGSVSVPRLFDVERYPTLWQMTSDVTARTNAPLAAIVGALHPSASVTGAPKFSTMALIKELEGRPRGVYTGAIGYLDPEGNARFSVGIRTAVVDCRLGTLEFGVGSGIVWDSDEAGEYEESLLKGAILSRPRGAFDLLETLRWAPDEGYLLLDRHLDRLADSARYFGVVCDPGAVRAALDEATAGATAPLRLRLLLGRAGGIRVERGPIRVSESPLRVACARRPVDRDDVFLFHKTTNRRVYDEARVEGLDDVLLWNRDGEITEATTANVVVERAGVKVTPPIACGLLAGTFRADLLARGEIVEGAIRRDDLRPGTRLWLINSVHGWRPAVVDPLEGG